MPSVIEELKVQQPVQGRVVGAPDPKVDLTGQPSLQEALLVPKDAAAGALGLASPAHMAFDLLAAFSAQHRTSITLSDFEMVKWTPDR